jgi:hypothetical protein
MKTHWLCILLPLCAGLSLAGCGAAVLDSGYSLELPEVPPAWEALLGAPHWRIEWINAGGGKEMKLAVPGKKGAKTEIALPQTWASAVTAWPYWPERGIAPGVFRPAGAIFPFDADGNTLAASWQGGVDAVLYWELAGAAALDTGRAAARLPWHFNWPRFRELFADSSLNAEVRADPWLADWRGIAEKIVQSGFDKRRLVPEDRGELSAPAAAGPWLGTSPFAPPLLFDGPPLFPVRGATDTWVSAEGILRCNNKAWIFLPWE